ncbi:SUKH-4 family immunity protein [Streptomyces sp. NPDC058291]|uniref:SUKH-4 family immunity protein n=1 Tax=Streptomyces sp. NPDC058291 TaxID=3346427 RepID=UPI0036E699D3
MGTTRTTTRTTITATKTITAEITAKITKKITPAEDELNPYDTHLPKHHWPTGPGLPGVPGDGVPLASGAPQPGRPRTDRPRAVADPTGAPEGRVTVLLAGIPGAISTPYFLHDGPDPMDPRPPAPPLEKLERCATAVDELAALRGQFTSYAARLGPEAAVQASRRLLAVFEAAAAEADDVVDAAGTAGVRRVNGGSRRPGGPGAPGLFWQLASVVRPLAPVAGPGTTSGLALDLPIRLLDDEFGSGAVVRFEDVDVPEALTHAPTRRFLRGRGLPEEGAGFSLATDAPLQTLAEHGADRGAERLPAGADRLIRLGRLREDISLVVDGCTGAVLTWSGPGLGLRPLNADISTLAFTLWLLRRERGPAAVRALTEAYDRLAETMCRTLAAADPVA